jgi:hypothetical protein
MGLRVAIPAEMAGRDLARRRSALVLLTALPLIFYLVLRSEEDHAVEVGGVAMAWSVAGATIFVMLAAREIDRRLVLAGYRPWQLLTGRLLLLTGLGTAIAGVFAAVMIIGSQPEHPLALAAGVELVTIVSVPFGLAVATIAPRELDAVLVMVGVVGIELSVPSTSGAAKVLPFWAARRLFDVSRGDDVSLTAPLMATIGWVTALLVLAAGLQARRMPTARRGRTTQPCPRHGCG